MGKLSNTKALSKVEKACIKGLLLDTDYDAIRIAKELGRDVGLVNEYIVVLQSEMENEAVAEPVTEVKKSKPETLYVNKTGTGKSGVVIATEAASSKSDAGHSKRISKAKQPQNYLYRIHE